MALAAVNSKPHDKAKISAHTFPFALIQLFLSISFFFFCFFFSLKLKFFLFLQFFLGKKKEEKDFNNTEVACWVDATDGCGLL